VDRRETPSDEQAKLIEEVSGVVEVVSLFGEHHHEELEGHLKSGMVDIVVMSPGVPLQSLFNEEEGDSNSNNNNKGLNRPHLISEFAFGAADLEEIGVRIAAITGTNGKTTVTHFVRQLLTSLGKKCIACGNIGRPVSDVALQLRQSRNNNKTNVLGGNGSSSDGEKDDMEKLDAVVVELSSYQLEIPSSFHPRVAVFLNLSSDHMERHGSMDAYAEAKANLCSNMAHENDLILVPKDNDLIETHVNAKNPNKCSRATIGRLPGLYVCNNAASVQLPWWFTHRDFCLGDIGKKTCLGEHNAWNAAVAVFVCFGLGFEWPTCQVDRALTHLKTPPHRMEMLEERVGGVSFVNDSKATNLDAASVGISALSPSKTSVVLLGGQAKRSSNSSDSCLGFKELAQALSRQKAVISFGQDGDQIREELKGQEVECVCVPTLKDAVEKAFAISSSGDTVLLSPACASFDEFRSFEDRGECFKKYVKELGS
jgi:UDP-N-acetylmuramoylalanine--D-glutamate ligase